MNELTIEKRKAILLILVILALALGLNFFRRIKGPSSEKLLNLDAQISQHLQTFRGINKKPISVNKADADTLCLLSGIGPVKAARIIEYRKNNGHFTSLDELLNVKGIGPKTLRKIKDEICL